MNGSRTPPGANTYPQDRCLKPSGAILARLEGKENARRVLLQGEGSKENPAGSEYLPTGAVPKPSEDTRAGCSCAWRPRPVNGGAVENYDVASGPPLSASPHPSSAGSRVCAPLGPFSGDPRVLKCRAPAATPDSLHNSTRIPAAGFAVGPSSAAKRVTS